MIRYNQYYKDSEKEGYNGQEESNRFLQLIVRAVAQCIISSSKGASLYNQKLADFRKTVLEIPE